MLFGTAGIRGDMHTITPECALSLGKSVAQFCRAHGGSRIVVGKDGRTSSDMLSQSVQAGILSQNCSVTDIGLVPTPVLAYASKDCGIMITASHNPPQYNGMKVFFQHRELFPHEEQEIEKLMNAPAAPISWELPSITPSDVLSSYIQALLSYIKKEWKTSHVAKRVVVDCGNGMGALVTPHILNKMGCTVIPLFNEIRGIFQRSAEPSASHILLARKTVVSQQADLGIAHDGDADRINVIDEKGNVIPEDSIIAFLAGVYAGESDHVITSIDTSLRIDEYVACKGGITDRVMLGNLHEGVCTYNAVFAGEPWKHIHVKFGPWIDGIVSAAVLTCAIKDIPASRLCAQINEYPMEKINITTENREYLCALFDKEIRHLSGIKEILTISGTRANFSDGSWILVRPSGTEPKVRIVIEGVTPHKFHSLKEFVDKTLNQSKYLYSIVN
ncbi:MAG: phosphoglucosamine mutase [Theionarchaea archaeon]|nr:phosphoglucosamine mutase [Theionarchaea archaeon]